MIEREQSARGGRALFSPLLVLLITLPALWPFLSHGALWDSHDGLVHIFRTQALRDAWSTGIWYPRLFPAFAFGYGLPVLHYYPPLPYYLALLLNLILPFEAAIRAAFALSYPAAALAAWWAGRSLWGSEARPSEWAGLAAATTYTYVPYHLANVQLRGALAESWAMVLLPLLFWALWTGRTRLLALALAALGLTHLLTAVMVALPLALWALLRLRTAPERGTTARGWGLALLLAALVALPFWGPLLADFDQIRLSTELGVEPLLAKQAPPREWLASGPGYLYLPDHDRQADHPFSWAQVALLALAAVGSLTSLLAKRDERLLFWWLVVLGSLFMLFPVSAALWRWLEFPLASLQFPWRFHTLTALATAMVVAAPLARPGSRWGRGLTAGLLFWLAASSLAALPWRPLPRPVSPYPDAMWASDMAIGQIGGSWSLEFLPRAYDAPPWALAGLPAEGAAPTPGRSPIRLLAAGWDGLHLWAEVETPTASLLTFPRFATGGRLLLDDVAVAVTPVPPLALAELEVPAGRHTLRLEPEPTVPRWLWLASAAALAGLALPTIRGRPRAALAGTATLLLLLLWGRGAARGGAVAYEAVESAPRPIGTQADLAGARVRLSEETNEETRLEVTLLWYSHDVGPEEIRTFVHLTDGEGQLLQQHDGVPHLRTAPASRWRPGQLVEDLHPLSLDPTLPAGDYQLWAGMYLLVDEQVVPLPDDSGARRPLGTIRLP